MMLLTEVKLKEAFLYCELKKFQLPFLEGRLNYLFIPYIENITKYIIIV